MATNFLLLWPHTRVSVRVVHLVVPNHLSNLTSHCSLTGTSARLGGGGSLPCALPIPCSFPHSHCIHEVPLDWNSSIPSVNQKSCPDLKNKLVFLLPWNILCLLQPSYKLSCERQHSVSGPRNTTLNYVAESGIMVCCKRNHQCSFKSMEVVRIQRDFMQPNCRMISYISTRLKRSWVLDENAPPCGCMERHILASPTVLWSILINCLISEVARRKFTHFSSLESIRQLVPTAGKIRGGKVGSPAALQVHLH